MTTITVYTDGACSNNGHENCAGAWCATLDYVDKFGKPHHDEKKDVVPADQHPTNIRMELMAVIAAIEFMQNYKVKLIINSDCQLVVNGCNGWVDVWQKREWMTVSKTPVMNQDLWTRFLKAREAIKASNGELEFKYVKGHAGIPGNEACNKFAQKSAKDLREASK